MGLRIRHTKNWHALKLGLLLMCLLCRCIVNTPVQRIRQLRQELDKQRQRAEAAEAMAAAADQAAAALDVKAERVQRFQVSSCCQPVLLGCCCWAGLVPQALGLSGLAGCTKLLPRLRRFHPEDYHRGCLELAPPICTPHADSLRKHLDSVWQLFTATATPILWLRRIT